MQNSLITILPPLLVLALAFATHKILFSLFSGIILGSLIYNDFAIIASAKNIVSTIWETTELESLTSLDSFTHSGNILLFIFLISLGTIITLMSYSGGSRAFQELMQKKIKTQDGAQTATMLLSNMFFLDDYFSCVTLGSIMHPITDKFKIARAKLAFLVNSLAPTLAAIIPLSSWSAAIALNIGNAGISDIISENQLVISDPFYLYLSIIPFTFYSLIMIPSVWFIVKNNISFGLMNKHEKIASKTGNLFGGKKEITKKEKLSNNKNATISAFLFPIISLISLIIILLLYTGNFYLLGGSSSFIEALKQGNPELSLMLGTIISLVISIIFLIIRKIIKIKDLAPIILEGINLLGPSIILLILAWSLTDVLNNQLLTGKYLASLFTKYVNIKLLPLLFYAITTLTSIAIGSAWGAMAIMIPISINMLVSFSGIQQPIPVNLLPMIYPLLGAILSGSVSGNHLSPSSDTMLMSSSSCKINHMDHVRSQHTYSFPAVISTAIAFLIAGILVGTVSIKLVMLISLSSGLLINLSFLKFCNKN